MNTQATRDNYEEIQRQGATLRSLRECQGLSVSQLSQDLQISDAHLHNIEAGRRHLTPQLLTKAARALDIPRIALIRDGYFDREQAEHEARLQKLSKERDEALEQVSQLMLTVSALERRLQDLAIPESRVLEGLRS